VGGRKGTSRRVLRLALAEKVQQNTVVTVDPVAGNAPGDNGTNGNNSNSEPFSADGDDSNNGNNGDSSGVWDREHDPDVDLQVSIDGRSRFTV